MVEDFREWMWVVLGLRGDGVGDSKPDYLVRVVKEINGRERWTDVGVAYRNKGGSITVLLSALPLNDRILLIPTGGE